MFLFMDSFATFRINDFCFNSDLKGTVNNKSSCRSMLNLPGIGSSSKENCGECGLIGEIGELTFPEVSNLSFESSVFGKEMDGVATTNFSSDFILVLCITELSELILTLSDRSTEPPESASDSFVSLCVSTLTPESDLFSESFAVFSSLLSQVLCVSLSTDVTVLLEISPVDAVWFLTRDTSGWLSFSTAVSDKTNKMQKKIKSNTNTSN